MSYKFIGEIINGFDPPSGVNLIIKGLADDKIILAPQKSYFYDNSGDNPLKFSLVPSSGVPGEMRRVNAEVKNCTEKVTPTAVGWDVEITASSESDPAEFSILFFEKGMEDD